MNKETDDFGLAPNKIEGSSMVYDTGMTLAEAQAMDKRLREEEEEEEHDKLMLKLWTI